jgi:hypothetical protein
VPPGDRWGHGVQGLTRIGLFTQLHALLPDCLVTVALPGCLSLALAAPSCCVTVAVSQVEVPAVVIDC